MNETPKLLVSSATCQDTAICSICVKEIDQIYIIMFADVSIQVSKKKPLISI